MTPAKPIPTAPPGSPPKPLEHESLAPHIPALPPPTKSHPVVTLIVWIVVLGVLAVVAFIAISYYSSSKKDANAAKRPERPIPIVVEDATQGDFPIYLENVGTVTAYQLVTIRTRIDGELRKVNFTEGQLVKEGDVLFQIDPRPYEVQLAQAEGQLAQTVGQIAKDTATRDNAERDLKRLQAASEAVAQRDIDAAQSAFENAKGALEADKGMVDTNKAAINSAKLNITYCTINAPITGTIGFRAVDQGNMVHASDPNGLAVITQLQPISVLFSPAQDNLPDVQKAMAENPKLPVEAWDRDRTRKLSTGTLQALDNQIDPTTATFKLKAVFANVDNALYPNQFVNVSLLIETLKNVVLVPEAAVQHSPTGLFVYVVKDAPPPKEGEKPANPDKSAKPDKAAAPDDAGKPETPPKVVEMREVTIGPTQNHLTVIKTGIAAGETVVTDGVDKLQPGTKVIPHKSGEPTAESQPASSTSAPARKGKKTR